MPANPRKLPLDVVEAGRAIQRHTASKTRDEYLTDEVLRGLVERKLLVIGEALTRLRDASPQTMERIPDAHRIIGQRNRIMHGYDTGDDLIVWDAVERHLPVLLSAAEALLEEAQ